MPSFGWGMQGMDPQQSTETWNGLPGQTPPQFSGIGWANPQQFGGGQFGGSMNPQQLGFLMQLLGYGGGMGGMGWGGGMQGMGMQQQFQPPQWGQQQTGWGAAQQMQNSSNPLMQQMAPLLQQQMQPQTGWPGGFHGGWANPQTGGPDYGSSLIGGWQGPPPYYAAPQKMY